MQNTSFYTYYELTDWTLSFHVLHIISIMMIVLTMIL